MAPPLVVHIIHRLAVGGLENGLVNLINGMPGHAYRHAIICLTDYSAFRTRLQRVDVPVLALHKQPGKDVGVHVRLWRVLKALRPDIVHTRNLPALEYIVTAALAGAPGRVHGEHGRDMYDLDGSNKRYNRLRKVIRPFVHQYTAVSADLALWLTQTTGIPAQQVTHVYNGVDARRFHPRIGPRLPLGPEGFAPANALVIGAVGRMQTVKDQLTLVRAFLHLLTGEPALRQRLRLVIIGDGPLRQEALRLLDAAGAAALAWLPGERADIPDLMRAFDLFVLPSLAEGISNTVLEAMATGLPVVATWVGGNVELVEDRRSGMLVPPANPEAMAVAIASYFMDEEQGSRHGRAGLRKIETQFSLEAMINGYRAVYDAVLQRRRLSNSRPACRVVDPLSLEGEGKTKLPATF